MKIQDEEVFLLWSRGITPRIEKERERERCLYRYKTKTVQVFCDGDMFQGLMGIFREELYMPEVQPTCTNAIHFPCVHACI